MAACSSTLGNSKSNEYIFGASEIRLGGLSDVLKLTGAHSLGVAQDVTLNYAREFTELRGGRNNPVLSRSVSQSDLTVTATLNEATHRNLSLLMGNGTPTTVFQPATTVGATASAGDVALTLTAAFGTDPVAGDLLIVHSAIDPAILQVVRVASVTTGTSITLHADTPLLFNVAISDVVDTVNAVSIGSSCGEEYLTCQILLDSVASKTPKVFMGWYGTITSSMEYSQSTTDYGTTSLEMSYYPVPANFTATGGEMEHAATEIAKHPLGFVTAHA